MKHLVFVCPYDGNEKARYKHLIEYISNYQFNSEVDVNFISSDTEFEKWLNQLHYYTMEYLINIRMVFVIHLDVTGINLTHMSILKRIESVSDCLSGIVAGIIIDGDSELHTKNIARQTAYILSQHGCLIPGGAFCEATGSLKNCRYKASNLKLTLKDAYFKCSIDTILNVINFENPNYAETSNRKKNLLCLYAGNKNTSNTYMYWSLIKDNLKNKNVHIDEINLRNGEISDCTGCSFEVCQHFSEKSSCFYGGVIVEKVYPAVINCDALIILCPNYNDSISANIMAFINRLTALYRKMSFNRKYLFSLVVSGYSGGDILAEQLISSLNFNKGFILPAKAISTVTANDSGEILKYPDIRDKALDICNNISGCLNV